MKILIVDDHAPVRRALGRILRGHAVTTVGSVAEARAALEDGAYDLIMSDVMMPDETGADFHFWISKMHPHLLARFIFVTGGCPLPQVAEYVEQCGAPVLLKPFEADLILETVGRFAA